MGSIPAEGTIILTEIQITLQEKFNDLHFEMIKTVFDNPEKETELMKNLFEITRNYNQC